MEELLIERMVGGGCVGVPRETKWTLAEGTFAKSVRLRMTTDVPVFTVLRSRAIL